MAHLYSIESECFSDYWPNELDNVFICTTEVIANRKLYRIFCSKILNVLNLSKLKPTLEPIFIVTSTSRYNIKYANDAFNKEFIKDFPHLTFLINSNILVRFIDINYSTIGVKQEIINSVIEYTLFLEKLPSHKSFVDNIYEYLYLNLNIQKVNELSLSYNSSGAHGKHITPYLYSNELKLRSEIEISNHLKFFLNEENTNSNEEIKKNGIVFRILLIDDKIKNDECKAHLIMQLLELDFDIEKRKDVCWLTNTVSGDTVNIFQDCCDKGCKNCLKIDIAITNEVESQRKSTSRENQLPQIQIFAVKNLSSARQLLTNDLLRFDLVMMDYLLDETTLGSSDREYATEFWGDGKERYFEFSKDPENKNRNKEFDKYEILRETYAKIKANRGPLQKLWIFPITAFNQTFIDDLRNKGVRLIDYYWYLSRGADPINTPYLFLNSLNKFLQLQLENAIFSVVEIKGFLEKSIQRLKTINSLPDFIAFMGSEYTVFVEKYMKRPVIYRDKEAGSLFSEFIWTNFYSKDKYLSLFKLIQHIHKFYHRCAFGTSADFDKMVLFWRELKLYIAEDSSLNIKLDIDVFLNKMIEIQPKR